MDRLETINRDRILWCCAERGITVDDLALASGVSAGALAKLMQDRAGLTFLQLRTIAQYFGRGVLFFLDPEPVDANRVHTAQYRTLTGQKPDVSFVVRHLIERVERQRELYLSLREEMAGEGHPAFEPPDVLGRDIGAAAQRVRDWLGLAAVNTFEGFRDAVERKGVLVFRSNGYAGRWQVDRHSPILGFSLAHEHCPVVFVRKTLWETKQTFTLMHELGHLILHRESSIDDEADMQSRDGHEREANAFAGRVLVPDTALDAIRDADRPDAVERFDAWLAPQRHALGVSAETILRRLLDMGRLPQAEYAAYRAHVGGTKFEEEAGGNRAYRHREPKHIFGKPFVRTVMDALGSRRIPASKACAALDGIKLKDLHQLERHIADL